MGEVVEYSVAYQDKDGSIFSVVWDVSTDLDPDTAAIYVLREAVRQGEEEDLEVLAMAKANKTIHKIGEFFETEYTSQFEKVDIYAPIFDGEARRNREPMLVPSKDTK
jgi:hypothetical protein